MPNDGELLQRYATNRSEAAFGELVQRHIALVYSAALRQVGGDAQLAQDVTQTVFADLAQKAKGLANRSSVAGWLYTSTRFTAAKLVRSEQRRRLREQRASVMHELHTIPEIDATWERLRLVLDEAMHELTEPEREVIVLRYFEDQDLKTLGCILGVSDEAARKRVERALERLRGVLHRRGITSTSGALGALLAGAVSTVPSGLAGIVITAAAQASTGAGVIVLNLLSIAQMKTALVTVVVVGLSISFIIQHRAHNRLETENAELREKAALVETLRSENARLSGNEVDAAELDRLRRKTQDLPRLRGLAARAANLQEQLTQNQKPAIAPVPEDDAAQDEDVLERLKRLGVRGLAAADFSALVGVFQDAKLFPKLETAALSELRDWRSETRTALAIQVVSRLAQELRNEEDQWTRWMSAITLGSFESDAKAAIPALVAALETRIGADWGLQMKAAEALGSIGPDAKDAVPALTTALQDGETGCAQVRRLPYGVSARMQRRRCRI